ncbi:MAG: hypothetical protein LBC62_06995, partial [Treponema sp.]|nr:hypothetical protein [Treponema sp.]
MVIEQIVEIPMGQELEHLHLDLPLPEKHPSGRVRVAVTLTQEAPVTGDISAVDIDAEISVNPPDFDEFCRLCDQAKQLNIPNVYTCEEAMEEAARRSTGMPALEYRRGAKRIRYWLKHRELWDETTRIIRDMRDEWDD